MNALGAGKLVVLLVAVVLCMGLVAGLAMAGSGEEQAFMLAGAGALALVAGLMLAYAMFRQSYRTLRLIEEGAARMARGEWQDEISLTSRNDYARLGALLNATARQLRDRLERIEDEQERLRTILESMLEGVMVLDAEGRVELVNVAFRTIFEVPPLPQGQTVLEVVRLADLQEAVDEVLGGAEVVTRELRLSHPRDKVLTAQVARIRGATNRYGVVAVFHDITQIKRLERIRQEFVANISHELRTPLTSIQGYTETLLNGAIDDADTARSFLGVMQRNVRQLAALIEDILTLSRIESSEAPFELRPCSLANLAEEAQQAMSPMAAVRRITLHSDLAMPDRTVMADRETLFQAITNLLDNAIKYTPEGGAVCLRVSREEDRACLAVEDNGIGIEPQHLDRIFERFYRVDRNRSRELGGTGLGLAIVKHIVQAHGGEVAVHSEPNHGSTFTIRLPFHAAPENGG